jgi:hypothetical protein
MNPDVCYEHGNTCDEKGCLCWVLMKEDCEQCLEEAAK